MGEENKRKSRLQTLGCSFNFLFVFVLFVWIVIFFSPFFRGWVGNLGVALYIISALDYSNEYIYFPAYLFIIISFILVIFSRML